jgi:hypothetical protein
VIHRIVAIEPRPQFRLFVRFDDGVEGVADLSDVAGRGVFRRWTDSPAEFFQVEVDPRSGAPTWPGELDVAPDALHDELARRSGAAVEHGR